MKLQKNRFLKIVALVVVVTSIVLFLTGLYLSYYLGKEVEKKLKDQGGRFSAFHVNLFSRSVALEDFHWESTASNGSNFPHTVDLKKISLTQISLYDLFANKKLKAHQLIFDDGTVHYNQSITLKRQPASSKKLLKAISIDYVIVRNVKANIVEDSLLKSNANINLTASDVQSSDTSTIANLQAYSFKNVEASVSKIIVNQKTLYRTTIGKIYVNVNEHEILIDSIFVKPLYSRYKFAKAAGKQIDRISAFVEKVSVKGLQFDNLKDSVFIASNIEISYGELFAFRDKRMPFLEKKNKLLPMAALKNMAYSIEVDTLKILDAKITYEEFPEDGYHSGKIEFDNLKATVANISSRNYYNKSKYTTLETRANVMGKGVIQASFLFPIADNLVYHAKGTISKLPLHRLNPVLENMAFISIESGKLNALKFDFKYNDNASDGTLTINYEDLKMKGLKKEKEGGTNDLKTFLLNAVVRNDKDKNTPLYKRTGLISFERDKKKQIFNFWWKSLLSGIKTSILSPTGKDKK